MARVISDLSTPIITGVGHETDTTIVDYVSDYRAPTPTGAAQIATPNLEEIRRLVNRNEFDLRRIMNDSIKQNQKRLDLIKQNRFIQ